MLELLEDEYANLPVDHPMKIEFDKNASKIAQEKDDIFHKLDHPPAAVSKVINFFDPIKLAEIKEKTGGAISLETLNSNGISASEFDEYYRNAKFLYECGMYEEAGRYLGLFLSVIQPPGSTVVNAMWGRLACRIVQAEWDGSLNDLSALKEAIENRNIPATDQIRQRAWLMHWGLFVYINQKDGMDSLVDFYSEKVYMQTLQNLCPWLLRYYTAAVILSSKRRTLIKDALAEIQSMAYLYSDPLTQFVECLFELFDFELAQQKLKECHALMSCDFFLQSSADKFLREGRLLVCEVYCTINRKVELSLLAEKLEMTEEEAEKWMVDMVRVGASGATLDARIDSSGMQAIMSVPIRSAHQLVVDRTRDLTVRSSVMASNLETLLSDQINYIRFR